LKRDELLPRLAQSGLQAVEVFHPDHDAADRARYLAVATEFDLVPTGGSDYHGPNTARASAFGRVGPGAADYTRLLTRRRGRLET
jgi:predicted metal-dependent phosphoesterase TrpH